MSQLATRPPHASAGGDLEPDVSVRLLVVLAFVAATSPLATDLYLASFPQIQSALSTTPAMVQLTLTAYLLGVSIGQPIWGPLSDRFGRRRPLVVSNVLTVVSSVAVALAPTIEVFIAARLVQALSAASGMVLARAMVSDLARGHAGVRALSIMMTVHGAVPVLAPALGGAMATFLPWRGVLGVFAAIVTAQLVAAIVLVPETLPPERRTSRLRYGDLWRIGRRWGFLGYVLTLSFCMAGVMTYVASSAFLLQEQLGLSAFVFGLTFAVNATGMAGAGLVSAALARRRVHPARVVSRGLVGLVVGSALVLLAPSPALVPAAVLVVSVSAGFVMGNCMGLAMEQSRDAPGAGSAVLGMFMFGISAVVTPVAALLGSGSSSVVVGAVMTTMSALAVVVFALGRLRLRRDPEAETAFAAAPPPTATTPTPTPTPTPPTVLIQEQT